jgi:hypothetical protein
LVGGKVLYCHLWDQRLTCDGTVLIIAHFLIILLASSSMVDVELKMLSFWGGAGEICLVHALKNNKTRLLLRKMLTSNLQQLAASIGQPVAMRLDILRPSRPLDYTLRLCATVVLPMPS